MFQTLIALLCMVHNLDYVFSEFRFKIHLKFLQTLQYKKDNSCEKSTLAAIIATSSHSNNGEPAASPRAISLVNQFEYIDH